ncbi:MAG: lysophospholipase [Rhodospirillales bacterium]|nr:lysophospholipase [Rhodospirillales bacterium]
MKGAAVALLALLLAACAPRIQAPGPMIADPEISETEFRTADGAVLPLRSWPAAGAEKAVVLALHGFNDYSNAFADVGDYLAGRGITVHAYDQRGFGDTAHRGLWPGHGTLAADLKSAADRLRARHKDVPFHLLGESMGGAVVMVAMTGPEPPDADGVILVAPAVWGRATMPWYQRAALFVASHTLPWLKLTGEGLNIRASDNDEMLRALGHDPLFIKETRIDAMHGITDLMDAALESAPRLNGRALVLYGEKDEIIPREPTFAMLAGLPGRADGTQRIALYENGFHMLMRDLQAETVWRDLAAWILDADAPLPSGAEKRAAKQLAGP